MGRVGEDTAESAGRGASTEPRTYFDQQRKPLLVATDTDEATVLVVEDEARVADTYAMRLRDRCATTVAYDGEEALETVNEDVDVILLNRALKNATYNECLHDLSSKKLKRNVLEVELPGPKVRESEQYRRFTEEIEAIEAEIGDLEDNLDIDDVPLSSTHRVPRSIGATRSTNAARPRRRAARPVTADRNRQTDGPGRATPRGCPTASRPIPRAWTTAG